MPEATHGRTDGLLTTGEVAEAAGVTVRTVQYYDQKGLVRPTGRTDGGRRLYDAAALERLRTVCVLKELGLPLKAIRGVLESDNSEEVLRCLLEEQEKELAGKAQTLSSMLGAVRAMRTSLSGADVPERPSATDSQDEARPDMEHTMEQVTNGFFAQEGTRLRATQRRMLIEGIVIDAVELACLVAGVTSGNWWPLAAAAPLYTIITVELVREYHRDARYVCPHCHATFQPALGEFFWAGHTPKTRKLTCTSCGTKDWCVEVAAE